jgi:long-chain-fatty-acid--CoA ligase ACSBG
MEMSTIIYIILMLVVGIILFYYLWYIKTDIEVNKDIPYNLLYGQDNTIVDLLESISKKYGHYPALKKKVDGKWKIITYAQYYSISLEFAEKLLYSVGPYPRVAILSHNRPEWLSIHMGTMIANGISIGVYPTASSDNCTYITNHACVDMLVVEDTKQLSKFYGVVMPTVKIILVLDEINKNESEADDIMTELMENIKTNNSNLTIIQYNNFINKNIGNFTTHTTINIKKTFPEEIATIIYTSGTTGDPKGVVISHKNIISSLKYGLHAIQSRSNINIYIQERFISYLPLNHVAAQLMDIYVPLASVGIVHFADKDALKNGSLNNIIKEVKPTIFIGVPRIWEKIMEKIKEKKEDPQKLLNRLFVNKIIVKEMGLNNCKYFITAAAPITDETRMFFKDLSIELCDVYGMSETTGPISMSVPGSSKGAGVPVMDIKIDKETNEIMVKGDAVFKEYYKDKQATDNAFNKKGWFKTGDTGHVDRDGSLYITGRIKDLIITSGGENISPIPMEDELLKQLNKDKKYFDYAIVIGDQKKFLSVLLVRTNKSLLGSKAKNINKVIENAIAETNKKAPNPTSTIKKYIIIENDTFEKNNCLTPTFKIRRSVINDLYKEMINNLYND